MNITTLLVSVSLFTSRIRCLKLEIQHLSIIENIFLPNIEETFIKSANY